ncbi:hypothetical protein Tco_1011814 [Tanacetum coccineum]
MSAYWRGISSEGDFLSTASSYTAIRDPMPRLYHRLIVCNIAGRSQAPEKVAPRPKRQPDAAAGAPKVVEGASDIDEGAQAVPTLVQAPQPPPGARPARTLSQRVDRLEEEVYEIREALGKKREVLDSMASDFSRFTIWTVTSLSLMMDRSRVRYTSYSNFRIPYLRRVRHRIGEVSTSVALLDED